MDVVDGAGISVKEKMKFEYFSEYKYSLDFTFKSLLFFFFVKYTDIIHFFHFLFDFIIRFRELKILSRFVIS